MIDSADIQQLTAAIREAAPAPTLALDAAALGRELGVGESTIRKYDAAGVIPAPVRIEGAVRWVRTEIEAWLRNGSPNRLQWERMKREGKTK